MDLTVQPLEYARGAWLEYVIRENVVVYCGVSDCHDLQPEVNTINAAGIIIKAIAQAVGQPAAKLIFFEFVTSMSWILKPGEYDFRLVERYRWHNREGITWKKTAMEVPPDIFEAFRRHIGAKTACKYTP